jgi:hypothetical protein
MKRFVSFASDRRVGVMLCGSVSVLLAACGGNGADSASPSASAPAPQFAALAYNGAMTPADIYVSPTGSDSNPGTQAAPFKTIARAAQAATPGVTILVAPGTYSGGFQTTASGTAEARIHYLSTTKYGARIVPPATSASATAWDNRGSYVDIDGFQVDGSSPQAGTAWVTGIYTAGSYSSVRNNAVHHIARTASCSGGGGGAIGSDSYYRGVGNDVVANIVHDVGPAGCALFYGIFMNTSDGKVNDNLVYAIADAGIRLWHDAARMTVSNNTVFNAGTGVLVGGDGGYIGAGPDDYTRVTNNILFDNTRYGVQELGATGTHNTYAFNLLFKNGSYNALLNNGLMPVASISADPQFVNYLRAGGGDYHIKASSPAVGAALRSDAPLTDLDGAPRNASTGYDLGAYQHVGSAPAPDPAPDPGPAPGPDPAPDPAPTPVPAPVPVTTYNFYVSPTGSDTNAGTKAAPFKTIARASRAALPSTTVFVAPGSYPGGIKTTVSGSASGRIYFVSSTMWGAKIVPPASSANDTAWDNRGDYVDIVGFEVDGGVAQSGTKWLHGIYNGGSHDAIRSNHVHDIAKSVACTSAGGSAIGVDSYYHGVQSEVIGNLVHDIGPAGCTFVQGIYISTSGSVKNNVVYRVAEAAIHLWHDANNVIITNNTVANSHTGIIVGGGDFYYTAGPDDNTAVYNNIVYDNYYGISEVGKTGTHNTYRNNLVFQNTVNLTLKNGLTATGTVSAAPQFAGYTRTGKPDFHLASTSPAIGKGTATNAYPTDFDGDPRNATTGYDIGAYQH